MSNHSKNSLLKLDYIAQALLLTLCSVNLYAQTLIQFDYNDDRQTIDHFGASDAWSINPTINKWNVENNQDDIERLADYLFSTENGIGLSAWRFNIGAGSAEQGSASNIPDSRRRAELLFSSANASVDKSKQAGQIRFLQEAHERGVNEFVAFSNSPPTWATKNGLAHPGNGSGIDSTNLNPSQTQNFGKFLAKVVQYLRGPDVGVPVNHLSPINEPTWAWQGQSQEGNRYNIDDMKSVYRATYDALQELGLSSAVKLDAAEVVEYTAALSDAKKIEFDGSVYSGGMNNRGLGKYKNYIDEFLGDNEFREMLGNKISMHGYFSDAWSDRMGRLRDLTWENVNEVSPGAKVWMSEMTILGGTGNVRSFGGSGWDVNDMEYALHVGKIIHRDLTRLNASAWHWWLGLTPYNYKDGLLKINSSLDASSLQTSKVLWTVGQFSRFLRPGYKRVHLPNVDNLNGLMASAYRAPDNSKLVVVILNGSNSAESIELNIESLPDNKALSSFAAHITNSDHNISRVSDAEVGSEYQIPANSTVTLVANLTDSGPITVTPGSGEPNLSGAYRLRNVFSQKCLRSLGNSTNNGAAVVQNTCDDEASSQWNAIETDTSGVYQLIQVASNKAMDMSGASSNPLGKAIIWPSHNGDNQRWILVKNTDNTFAIANLNSGLVLDVNNSSTSDDTTIVQDYTNGGESQKWQLITPSSAPQKVQLKKRNAQSFAIDGNNGGANRQNVYLYVSNASNENQQWNEIDRGNGYYSYQKTNTDYCLDGDNGGANGQNVYLWSCSENNHNQHWKKVSVSGDTYRLEKRNAPEFALDGNHGGANLQNLYLWRIGTSNQNQQWIFTTVN